MIAVNKNNINGFSISFVLHILVAYTLFYVVNNKIDFNQNTQEYLTISLDSFEIPKVVPQVVKTEQIIQKQTEEKVVEKQEVQNTQHVEVLKQIEIEKKEIQNTQHVEVEDVKNISKSEITQETLLHVEKKEELSVEEMQEAFVKTNFHSIRDKVLANLKYPPIAKRMRQSGIVELLLVIDTKGKLVDISVHKSSGHKLLDKSAMSAAGKLCTQALPIPQTISRVTLPISFALN